MAPKRKSYSLAEKLSIIEKAQEFHGTKVELAKSLGIATTTLQTILKQKDVVELNSQRLDNSAKRRKKLKPSPYQELENILMTWFNQARAANIPINGSS